LISQKPDEEAVYNAARKITAGDAREVYVKQACGNDQAVLVRVRALLKVHDEENSFLAAPVAAPVATVDQPLREGEGAVIGPYKLLEQIGVGGFGVVFMAEQQHPLRRKVAVKVIKPGMDTRHVIARFEAERQALALMDHPNIARVLDAGETPSGQPYFVMELVRGLPITEHCDRNRLTPRQRLELFVNVGQAVQHAHQKGIIHRDLKPSNVLVTLHDGVPVVKVIDFGVAKATGQQLTEKTLFTNFAQMVGTPLYMSPEQAEMSGLDVDTRSDIYSLGVLLYELLTGTTPFDKQRLREAAFDEVRRIIREEEPPRPSTRMSASATLANIAAQRQTDPKLLCQLFLGEVDWIVMKALEKDRSRRYETANSLVRDIQRYLDDEPVEACPPSAMYRFRKFARRHKGVLGAAAVITLALLLGIAVSSWQAIRATQAEELAAERSEIAQANYLAAEKAKEQATRRLYDARLAQAQAGRLSRRVGQRFDSLDAIAEAAKIARELNLPEENLLALRNTAIVCLALPDLRQGDPLADCPAGRFQIDFDGRLERYALADHQGAVIVRRMADGHLIATLPGSGAEAWPLFSRDGKFLAVAGKGLRVWRLDDDDPVTVVRSPAGGHYGHDFSPDSRQFAIGHADGSISLHDLASGQPPRRLAGALRPKALAFHPSGRQLAVAHGASVQVLDLDTENVTATLPHRLGVASLAWHPDGKMLAVAHQGPARIHLWDVPALKQTHVLEGIRNGGVTMAFNHAGDRLASTGWDGMLRLWDPRTGQQLFGTTSGMGIPRFSPDDRLLSGDIGHRKLRLWEVSACREYRTLVLASTAGQLEYQITAIRPDGRLLAVGTFEGVGLWDLATGKEFEFLKSSGSTAVLFEPSPSGALLTNGSAGLLRWPAKVEPDSPGVLRIGPPRKLSIPGPIVNVAASRDGRVIAVAQFRGGRVLHLDRPGQLVVLGPHDDARGVAVSPDGRWVATGSHTGTGVKVWESQSGKCVAELLPQIGSYVGFSPNGKWLLTTGGGCRLWSVDSWLAGPKIGGDSAAFSADSKMLAVTNGSAVRLVDPDSGREFASLDDPNQDRPRDIIFSPDGTLLVAANDDSRSVHVWDLRLIREQLAAMGLDWDLPKYPASGGDDRKPLRVHVTQLPRAYVRSREWDKAIEAYARAIEVEPTDAESLNNLAWLLATCPELKVRAAAKAVALAQKAVDLDPKDGSYWNTLGVARYRAGDCKAAVAALLRSKELLGEKELAFNAFFLAMAHWQLGNDKEARAWLDDALNWMKKNKPQDEELQRFRTEAARVFGLESNDGKQEPELQKKQT
jgi:eukaryotic-like serine/threonine-protein kinase